MSIYEPPQTTEVPDTRTNHHFRWATLVLSMGLVAVAGVVLEVEWSSPYCNDPQDGPSWAVFGAPLPYERFSGVSSSHYYFVPYLYLLNITILSGLAWPLVRWAAQRAVRRWPRLTYGSIGLFGVLLCALVGAGRALQLTTKEWSPVVSIVRSPYESYRELRPVGVSVGRHYECTPSMFWFGRRPAERAE